MTDTKAIEALDELRELAYGCGGRSCDDIQGYVKTIRRALQRPGDNKRVKVLKEALRGLIETAEYANEAEEFDFEMMEDLDKAKKALGEDK